MNRAKPWLSLFALAPLLMASIWFGKQDRQKGNTVKPYTIETTPFTITRSFEGVIQSAKSVDVASTLNQASTISYLVEEGSIVTQGQLIVRFDEGLLQRDVYRLEKELQLAQTELVRVQKADIPLEQYEVDSEISQASIKLEDLQNFLSGSNELFLEGLLSQTDLEKHEASVLYAKAQLTALTRKKGIMDSISHPALTEQAEARVHFAEQELSYIKKQFDACNIYASQSGMALLKPLHLQNEFRTARTGDSLYRNQVFMQIADMSDMHVQCYIPESEIAKVPLGAEANISPQAFPQMKLNAQVSHIGSMAHSLAGRPAWQKFFRCTLTLTEAPDNLRMGMSTNIDIISYARNAALLIPRRLIHWEEEGAYCFVKNGKHLEAQALSLGMSNASHVEIIAGLSEGAEVYQP